MSDGKQEWHWLPPVPLDDSVYFAWPPRPVALVRHLLGTGYLLSTHGLYTLLAIASWHILGPAERWTTFEFDWIALAYALNLGIAVAIGGGLHLYFYTFARQGMERKLNPAPLAENNPRFLSADQTRDTFLDLRERCDGDDSVPGRGHVGVRAGCGAVARMGVESCLVRVTVSAAPSLGELALLLHPPAPALEAAVPGSPRPTSPERQTRVHGRVFRCIRSSTFCTSAQS